MFLREYVDEARMLEVNKRLQRVTMIIKLLVDQEINELKLSFAEPSMQRPPAASERFFVYNFLT